MRILNNAQKDFREWIAIRDSIIIDLINRSPEKLEEFVKATADDILVDTEMLRRYRDGEATNICAWIEGANGVIIKSVNFS